MSGIVANCDSCGGISLSGTGPGWGALAGKGVTVGAKQTRVLTVRENLPPGAVDHGMVAVTCSFGYRQPRQPADCAKVAPVKTPVPQGKATGGLAYTGASVLAIGLTGLAALVAGTAGVVAARRRKA